MRDYELVVLLPPDGKQDSVLETVKKTVLQHRGTVGRVDEWGKKALRYPIEKQREALYFLLNIRLPPEGVSPLERTLRINENTLRHLLVRREGRKPTKVKTPEKKIKKGVKTKKK